MMRFLLCSLTFRNVPRLAKHLSMATTFRTKARTTQRNHLRLILFMIPLRNICRLCVLKVLEKSLSMKKMNPYGLISMEMSKLNMDKYIATMLTKLLFANFSALVTAPKTKKVIENLVQNLVPGLADSYTLSSRNEAVTFLSGNREDTRVSANNSILSFFETSHILALGIVPRQKENTAHVHSLGILREKRN